MLQMLQKTSNNIHEDSAIFQVELFTVFVSEPTRSYHLAQLIITFTGKYDK